jgi:DNA polymerase-3 subunit alpha
VVALRGKVDLSRGEPAFRVEDVSDPEGLKEKSVREVHIRLDAKGLAKDEDMMALRDLIFECSGGCQVYFHLMRKEKETIVKAGTQIGISPADEVADRLRLMPAVTDVWKE